jgi:hypothetical protein
MASVPEASRAYIVGTLAIECEPRKAGCIQLFNDMSVSYRSTDGKGIDARLRYVWGSMFGGDTVADYTRMDRNDKGMHFCVPLPPGAYQFYTYEFYNYAGGGSGFSLRKESQFDLPFTLAPGEVAYVGTLKLTTNVGKNIFGMRLPAPGILLLSGAPSSNIPAAMQKCPESVRGHKVRDASLKAPPAAHPYVMDDPRP